MAGMSRNNSTSAFQGFSVSQAFIGAPLQWLPAMGTAELDELVHAFLPGPSSIQDKRAHISMGFFEYSRQTGETFKFYAVPLASYGAASTNSPATSSSMYESGYTSSFNVSPIISDLSPWAQSPASFSAPSVTSEKERTKSQSSSKKSPASGSRQAVDFTNHPGMRIMTRDGRDVTNSASRGSKTKEQRDHAHLMRIIKACPDCKRKKIRCDPSHKKKSSTQATPSAPQPQRPARKERRKTESPPIPATPPVETDMATTGTFDLTAIPDLATFGGDQMDKMWDEFVQFESDPLDSLTQLTDFSIPQDFDFFSVPQDFNFNTAPQSNFTPSLGTGSSSASPSQLFTPFTPPQQPVPVQSGDSGEAATNGLSANEPMLPYLNPGEPHGTNYVDFNLYSPQSDFLDEELRPVRALPPQSLQSRESPQRSVSPVIRQEVIAHHMLLRTAPIEHADGLVQDGPFRLPTTTSATHQPAGLLATHPDVSAVHLTTQPEHPVAEESGVAPRPTPLVRSSHGVALQTRNAGDRPSPVVTTSHTADIHGGLLQDHESGSESGRQERRRGDTQEFLTPASRVLQEVQEFTRPQANERVSSTTRAPAPLQKPMNALSTPEQLRSARSATNLVDTPGQLCNAQCPTDLDTQCAGAHAPTRSTSADLGRTRPETSGLAPLERASGLNSARLATSSPRRAAKDSAANARNSRKTHGSEVPATQAGGIAGLVEHIDEAMLFAVLGLVLYMFVSATGFQQGFGEISQRLPSLLTLAGTCLLPVNGPEKSLRKKATLSESTLRRMVQRVFQSEGHRPSYPAVGNNGEESQHRCVPKTAQGSGIPRRSIAGALESFA